MQQSELEMFGSVTSAKRGCGRIYRVRSRTKNRLIEAAWITGSAAVIFAVVALVLGFVSTLNIF